MLYLVYEINEHMSGYEAFDEGKLILFDNKEDALAELVSRKEKYISIESNFEYNSEESTDDFVLFSHIRDEDECFYIRMVEITPKGTVPTISRLRLEELCTKFKDGLIEDGEDEAYTYFREECEITPEEAEWLGLNTDMLSGNAKEDNFDDSAAWEDDSNRCCKDCPPDECTGHCMSCFYRPV